jgi:hypothetical protein
MSHRDTILIRSSSEADVRALERLALLDSVRPTDGPALVAEVDGELVAALQDGRAIADPFAETAHVVEMLRAHAEALGAETAQTGAQPVLTPLAA